MGWSGDFHGMVSATPVGSIRLGSGSPHELGFRMGRACRQPHDASAGASVATGGTGGTRGTAGQNSRLDRVKEHSRSQPGAVMGRDGAGYGGMWRDGAGCVRMRWDVAG